MPYLFGGNVMREADKPFSLNLHFILNLPTADIICHSSSICDWALGNCQKQSHLNIHTVYEDSLGLPHAFEYLVSSGK